MQDFLFWFHFPCSVDHEREWLPCKIVVFRIGNQYAECDKQTATYFDSYLKVLLPESMYPDLPVIIRMFIKPYTSYDYNFTFD